MGAEAAGVAGLIGGLVVSILIFMLIAAAIVIFPHWRMFQRAGYSGALALLMFIPLVNLIVLLWFAFADWPVLRAAAAPAADPQRRFGL